MVPHDEAWHTPRTAIYRAAWKTRYRKSVSDTVNGIGVQHPSRPIDAHEITTCAHKMQERRIKLRDLGWPLGVNPVEDPGDNVDPETGVVVGDDTPECATPEQVLASGLCKNVIVGTGS